MAQAPDPTPSPNPLKGTPNDLSTRADADFPLTLQDIARAIGQYPVEAYEFVHQGLGVACARFHANTPPLDSAGAESSHHITGQQLAVGLRDYAWERWGFLARAVLQRWSITSTLDFGKIVYALIDGGILSKQDSDRLEDFANVFPFITLESQYKLPLPRP